MQPGLLLATHNLDDLPRFWKATSKRQLFIILTFLYKFINHLMMAGMALYTVVFLTTILLLYQDDFELITLPTYYFSAVPGLF